MLKKLVFVFGIILCLFPFVSPQIALGLGMVVGIAFGNPFPHYTPKTAKYLLQASVVGLGFGINLDQVLATTQTGIIFTIATIFGTLGVGFLVGRFLRIGQTISHLISSGTAICGGSAIAAVGHVVEANEKEMSVSLGIVFILNAVALFAFPLIGRLLDLSQVQFGIWSAIAIHDTSSVVAAASRYGEEAMLVATTVKLFRALWIVPLVIVTALAIGRDKFRIAFPYFILFFLVASLLSTASGSVASYSVELVRLAKVGMTITLFLIGSGLSRSLLTGLGFRPLLLGTFLWLIVAASTLGAVILFV